jgi:glycosyltransferase involved in cell wall biosynthesis
LKIALIRRTHITYLDGVNRFITLLAEGLKRLGHEVEIFGWCYRGVDRERLEEWFREIHGLDMSIPIHTLREECCEVDSWIRIALDWLLKGSAMLQESKFDATIVSGIIPLRFKPRVAVIHDLGPAFTFNKLYVLLGKIVLKYYNEIICVSTKTQQELRSILKLPCKVIPIPLKLDAFKPRNPNERENIVVHIGTRPDKNPWVSIEAIKILKERGLDVKLIIIGPSARLPRTGEVEYAFEVSEERKKLLLCKAKALILPSKYEGFSYTALEAMACGTPVVVSNAVPEEVIINNFNGIRINSFNPEDYANALESLLKNDELWLKLSKNGLEFVKQFNYIEIAKKYIDLIRELL